MAGAARRAARVFRSALVLTVALAAILIAVAPVLCTTVFGERFQDSGVQLRILCLGAFGIVAIKLLGDALTAQRRPLLSTAAAAVGLVFTVGLDLLLIPSHGGLGASVASSIAYTAGGVAAAILFVRVLGARAADLWPRRSDLRSLAHHAAKLAAMLRQRATA
jgi:O-antigen/teichoic acid export membrane protein